MSLCQCRINLENIAQFLGLVLLFCPVLFAIVLNVHLTAPDCTTRSPGVKAFYFGRKVEAEKWLGLSYTVSKACLSLDKQTLEKIRQVLTQSEAIFHENVLERGNNPCQKGPF